MALTLRTKSNPGFNTKGSELSWDEMDQNLIELFGLADSLLPTGVVFDYTGTSAPSGRWLICNGDTIGNASSGATHAGSDFEELFKLIWNSTSNFNYQLLDSSGNTETRSGGADTDWNLDRRIPIHDLRGRVTVGSGQGQNLTNRTHLVSFGVESEDLTHSHTNTFSVDNNNIISTSTAYAGGHTPSGTVSITSGGSHQHSVDITTSSDSAGTPSGSITVDSATVPIDDHGTTKASLTTSDDGTAVVTDPTHTSTSHNHTGSFSGNQMNTHSHSVNGQTISGDGSHSHPATFEGDQVSDHRHNVEIPAHSHPLTGEIGSKSLTSSSMQPSLPMNKIIKY